MSPRPTIFISSVSKELRSARQLVANTLTFLGYEPVWQDIFGTEGGDLRQMLRQQIDQCKGVVQLIGQAYGAEPPAPDEEFGRVSYTQYEALYARKKGKKVWYLFMDESFPIDKHEPEPEEQRHLQAAYRNMLKVDTHLFHPLATREALEAGVLKLRDDLTQLRRGAKQWAWGVAALLVVVTLLTLWLVRGQGKMTAQLEKSGGSLEKIAQRFESLATMGGLIPGAKTPEEHYHNARIHELGGNFSAARKEYAEYLSSNLEALDPWQSYAAMLKAAEGKAGAVEAMRYFADKLVPHTVSYETALALLEDGEARLTKLQALAAAHPDFGPLPVAHQPGILRGPARRPDARRPARGKGMAREIPRRACRREIREILPRQKRGAEMDRSRGRSLGQIVEHAGQGPRKSGLADRAVLQRRLGCYLHADGFQGEGAFLQARREREIFSPRASFHTRIHRPACR